MQRKKSIHLVVVVLLIGLGIGAMSLQQSGTPASPIEQKQVMATINYEQHYFYGESLHLEVGQPVEMYELINQKNQKVLTFSGTNLDEAIDLAQVPVGTYDIVINGATVMSDNPLSQTWYTMTRNKKAKQVIIETSETNVQLVVKSVKNLPTEVYDIVIDPGHGGLDSGTTGYGLYESEEVLKISEYIASELEKQGLKVKLTRSGDYEPAGDETFNSERSPYYPNGRIEQVYTSQAKLFLSNHLNATESSLANGFQIYSSFLTSNTLALTLSEQM